MNSKRGQITGRSFCTRFALVAVCDDGDGNGSIERAKSLRDIVEGLSTQSHRLYHLGSVVPWANFRSTQRNIRGRSP